LLAQGKSSSRTLVEEALARITDANGEGGRAFTKVHAQSALSAADASDRARKEGVRSLRSPACRSRSRIF